jgi:hypothetical protein
MVNGQMSGGYGTQANYIIDHSNSLNTMVLTNSLNSFLGDIRNDAGFTRLSAGGQLGVITNTLRGSGGTWEVRTDAAAGFAGRPFSEQDGSFTLLADRAVGGAGINQTLTFGNFYQSDNRTITFNSRNGYGISFASTSGNMSGTNPDLLTSLTSCWPPRTCKPGSPIQRAFLLRFNT